MLQRMPAIIPLVLFSTRSLISKSAILVSWLVLCLHLKRTTQLLKRELLAIVFALKWFHPFLWGNPFTLYTDHKALTYLHTQKYANTMMMNWFDTILDYQFKVIHLPRMDNILPDHLSRLFPTDQMLKGSEQDTRAKNGIIHTAIRAIR